MWSKVKNLLGFHTDMPDYDIIMTRIWHDTKMQHFVAHIVVLLSEIIMVIAISVRPGGPFLNVRRTTYFFLYWSLIIVCVITMLTQRWLNRKEKDYRHFYRLELFFLAFFSFWGVGISLNDQLGGNDVTVYTYTVLIVAFISVVQPWKIGIVLLISYLLLMLLFPFFPNPMDGQQFNNIINSFFPTMTAFLIAANFYHSRIRLKKDDLTIERQYQQIKEGHDALLVTAYTDTLTGLFNRSGYTQRIQELEQLKKQNISCIYLDANGLHEINNHLGHQGGDQMLVCIATALRNQFDPNNIFRIGGMSLWSSVQICLSRSCNREFSISAKKLSFRNILFRWDMRGVKSKRHLLSTSSITLRRLCEPTNASTTKITDICGSTGSSITKWKTLFWRKKILNCS